MLARSSEGAVFGGYASCPWSEETYTSDPRGKGFLFSVNRLKVYGLRRDMEQTAIHNSQDLGPTFGRGHDLVLHDCCDRNNFSHSNLGKTYECTEAYGSN